MKKRNLPNGKFRSGIDQSKPIGEVVNRKSESAMAAMENTQSERERESTCTARELQFSKTEANAAFYDGLSNNDSASSLWLGKTACRSRNTDSFFFFIYIYIYIN